MTTGLRMKGPHISYERAFEIAKAIGQIDFRAALSRYATHNGYPWVVTVGENAWERHLVIEKVEGEVVTLGLLPVEQTGPGVINLDVTRIERRVTLAELRKDGYRGALAILQPAALAKKDEHLIYERRPSVLQ